MGTFEATTAPETRVPSASSFASRGFCEAATIDGVFGYFRKKSAPSKVDPLAAYDGVIDSLERQAAQVRKSAATLLALRGELSRDRDRYAKRLVDLEARVGEAGEKGDAKAERVLRRDFDEAQRLKAQTESALDGAKADAELLMTAAEDLATKVSALKTERLSAKARFAAGATVSETMRAQVEEFDRVVKLDAARDEVEKAHALADLYRDEAKTKLR